MKTVNIHNIAGIAFFLFSITCSCQNLDLKSKKIAEDTKNSMQKDYILEKEKICDLNNDQKNDIILIYKTRNIDTEIETFDVPVILILSQNNNYVKMNNSNILYSYVPNNSVLNHNLVIKNEFFTLEQTEGDGNSKKKTYITFRFDKNSKHILLSKYGVETSFPGKENMIIKTKIFSTKDFGKIRFEDFNSDSISSIIKYSN